MKIGNINDKSFLDSIKNFYSPCSCEQFRLRKGLPSENVNIDCLNIELSLKCQGACALCSVNSPSWSGTYDKYPILTGIVDTIRPKEIFVQGGEVLIQEESLRWIEGIRSSHPGIKFSIVTNGNVKSAMIDTVENIFHRIIISFMAFQRETYERVMGMDIEKTIKFAEGLSKRKKSELILKFLLTPISIHEANLFLKWAITLSPVSIYIEEAWITQYINMETTDEFWKKILYRTAQEIKATLINNRQILSWGITSVQFTNRSLKVLGLYTGWDDFLVKNKLQNAVTIFLV